MGDEEWMVKKNRADKKKRRKKRHSRCGEKRRINNPPSSSISLLVLLDGLSITLPSSDLPEKLISFLTMEQPFNSNF